MVSESRIIDGSCALGNAPVITVGALSQQIRRLVETGFSHVRVRGEIGACTLHSSGHLYLSLKDESAVLAGVCWRGQMARLGLKPATGMDVICTGKLTTFPGQSKYQIVIEAMELAGLGALLKMLEERRAKLQAEGLFDPARKKKIPFLPRVIGVVTSPTGAVIRDILHRLEDRFPSHVLIWPVAVQGQDAAPQIAAAIKGFNALAARPDLLIVARGGGSLEDLMAFNEEEVVRAVAESSIPVITAVGHETDTTLVDYAADLRAPTPTAAAEMAVPVRHELLETTKKAAMRLEVALNRMLAERKDRLYFVTKAIREPSHALMPLAQRLDYLAARLARLKTEIYLQPQKKLEHLASVLQALSPRAVLGRGYALVYDEKSHVISSAQTVKQNDRLIIEWQDGKHQVSVK
ncbi:MAG: exodeoxyribonuclease VII large subunit [Alphaproteobacteria bacterium]|nr:exodeoxyribonuclease VII large subunit [Alphaproteobacteria bacterium]